MLNNKILLIAKYIVGSVWILGVLEICFALTPIPAIWLWILVAVSLLLHFIQSVYFYISYREQIDDMLPHIAQIMIFGMAHVLTMKVSFSEQ